jgi:hypothetical protein
MCNHGCTIRTIVFVCQHGAVKSVIAAALLERLGRETGTALSAIPRGTEPDADVPTAVVAGLAERGLHLGAASPQLVTAQELRNATHVVSFGPDLGIGEEHWDDVPALADVGFARCHDAIAARVPALLARIAG